MARILFVTAAVGFAVLACAEDPAPSDQKAAAARVLSEDPAVASAAIEALRAAGPAGLATLLDQYADLLTSPPGMAPSPEPRLKAAIDAVAGQRDADISKLYWYTDLDAAQAAARAENKPILSLRMLGRLTDEFSCANSRFFRTALYSNREVSDYLRSRFILHWQSVRAVPKITIDFGDGRKLERTITGNSIHYVIDAEGRPFDALPGLYGPQAFLRELKLIEAAFEKISKTDGPQRPSALVRYHQSRIQATQEQWQRDLAELKIDAGTPRRAIPNAAQPLRGRPDAARAGERAIPKQIVERPLLQAMALTPTAALRRVTTDDVWFQLGRLHEKDAVLDQSSIALIRRQNGYTSADLLLCYVSPDESRLTAMITGFQSAMSADAVRNEYEFRRRIHEWLVEAPDVQLESLNERVYAELFLTPRSDPWLGLEAPETYTALENGGRTAP